MTAMLRYLVLLRLNTSKLKYLAGSTGSAKKSLYAPKRFTKRKRNDEEIL